MDTLGKEKARSGAHESTPAWIKYSAIELEDGRQNETTRQGRPSYSMRRRVLYVLLAFALYITICVLSPYPYEKDGRRFGMFDNATTIRPSSPSSQKHRHNRPWSYHAAEYHVGPSSSPPPSPKTSAYLDPVHDVGALSVPEAASRYAYATLFTGNQDHPFDDDLEDDPLFVGCRMLAYQLLHAPETRSLGIPLLVLTTPETSEAKKERLRLDGATVIEIKSIDTPESMQEENVTKHRLAGGLDKLRLWELEQYNRILYLDPETIIARPMDALFTSVSVQSSSPLPSSFRTPLLVPPEKYLLAAGFEDHDGYQFLPTEADRSQGGYFNTGFMLLMPSRSMLDYYKAVLAQSDSVSKTFLSDQSLLSAVHALDGPLPVTVIDPIWNAHVASRADLDAGVHSLYVKWWKPVHEDIRNFCMLMRWRMTTFFESRDFEMREASSPS